jgi:hypothetical protein
MLDPVAEDWKKWEFTESFAARFGFDAAILLSDILVVPHAPILPESSCHWNYRAFACVTS